MKTSSRVRPESAATGSMGPAQTQNPRRASGTAPADGATSPANGRVLPPPAATDPSRPDVLDPRPLAAPLPLIECCNKPPPGCGHCFFCLMRAAGLTVTESLVDAAIEILKRPSKRTGGSR
jgi:hypothetical protein